MSASSKVELILVSVVAFVSHEVSSAVSELVKILKMKPLLTWRFRRQGVGAMCVPVPVGGGARVWTGECRYLLNNGCRSWIYERSDPRRADVALQLSRLLFWCDGVRPGACAGEGCLQM